ncbi:L,D-transpeptidase family protein [Pelagibacteraceae bacterium]|nr:L,D-transpeptidase family protein [Pelagibacteraceae bacterium]
MHILIKNKYFIYNNYRIKCAVGKRGIKKKLKEGDLITPTGRFNIKLILYREDRIKKLNTSLRKLAIKKNMGWCDDPDSNKYNKLITLPFKYSHERLFRKDRIYDIILVLNYNMNPIKKNKGSAIFIHVAKNNFKPTEGCIALKKHDLLKITKDLRSNTEIRII